MTSPLPPRRRDSRNLADLIRHQKQNLKRLAPGFVNGRFPPARLRGHEDGGADEDDFADEPTIAWEWGDRLAVTATGTQVARLSHVPLDESLFVRWHPGGDGGLPWTNEFFTVTDQTVTIPNPGYLAVGDTFSFQYEYEVADPEPIDPSVVGFTEPGVVDDPTKTVTYALPAGTAAGDLLVLSVRGQVAPGGGELILGTTCADPRMTLAFKATTLNSGQAIVESVWVGTEDGSGSPVVVHVVPNPSYVAAARGVLASITGANGAGTVSAVESGTTTPSISGVCALAVTWLRGNTTVNAAPPSGFTNVASSGADYYSTAIGFWYDPNADSETPGTSPAGTFSAEGCCVVAIT